MEVFADLSIREVSEIAIKQEPGTVAVTRASRRRNVAPILPSPDAHMLKEFHEYLGKGFVELGDAVMKVVLEETVKDIKERLLEGMHRSKSAIQVDLVSDAEEEEPMVGTVPC